MLKMQCTAKCIEVKKKSTSPAFTNVKVGDIIYFSSEIRANQNLHGNASYISCHNPQTGKWSTLSYNQLSRLLTESFTFVQL